MDASRHNSPSRKSRFRAQGGAPFRPAPAEENTPEVEESAPVYAEEVDAEGTPVDAAGVPVHADETTGHAEEGAVYAEDPTLYAEEAAPSAGAMEYPAHEPLPDEAQAAWAPVEEAEPERDNLPAGLRLTRSSDDLRTRHGGIPIWVAALTAALCLALGGLAGYYLHSGNASASNTPTNQRAAAERSAPVIPLAPAVLADVDAAFAANKQGQFTDAHHRFDVLADSHPSWISMRIEAARAALYEHDFDAAGKILNAIQRAGTNVDAAFLTGLLDMTMQTYDKSEAAFAQAVAIDPARPDIFYFWGECLRREGKPLDAAEKFREALIRNQYETTEGLYQLKLWLSEIQANQEGAKDTNTKIDADLASGHPSGPGLLGAAAREIKAEQFKEAGAHIGQAQKVMEPAVFRVILQDPTFLEQNFRPEIAPYYQQ